MLYRMNHLELFGGWVVPKQIHKFWCVGQKSKHLPNFQQKQLKKNTLNEVLGQGSILCQQLCFLHHGRKWKSYISTCLLPKQMKYYFHQHGFKALTFIIFHTFIFIIEKSSSIKPVSLRCKQHFIMGFSAITLPLCAISNN